MWEYSRIKTFIHKYFTQYIIMKKNSKKLIRYLEIGPGTGRIEGFETINIVKTNITDYIQDIRSNINFPDNTFDLIYTSHFLEHIEWYHIKKVLDEIYRVLKPNAVIEIWVPDGLKIAKAYVDAENNNSKDYYKDGWFKFNEKEDPCVWFSGRIISYGDGKCTRGHFNIHLSTFNERYLKQLLLDTGFRNVRIMANSECRGYDHGWINLGIKAEK